MFFSENKTEVAIGVIIALFAAVLFLEYQNETLHHPPLPRCGCIRSEIAPTVIVVGDIVVMLPAAVHCAERERSTALHPCELDDE